jgi:hypothetical protein
LSVVLYGCETKQHIEVTYEEDADEDIWT